MAKKEDEEEIVVVLGPFPRAGRKPKKMEKLDDQLNHLIKESERWKRLMAESWFPIDDPKIKIATGATDIPNIVGIYDEAIMAVRKVVKYAKAAEEFLRSGKEVARKKSKKKRATKKA